MRRPHGSFWDRTARRRNRSRSFCAAVIFYLWASTNPARRKICSPTWTTYSEARVIRQQKSRKHGWQGISKNCHGNSSLTSIMTRQHLPASTSAVCACTPGAAAAQRRKQESDGAMHRVRKNQSGAAPARRSGTVRYRKKTETVRKQISHLIIGRKNTFTQ